MIINIMETNTLIDFHAHILPGMDHGCDDVAMSIEQLRMAADHNIEIVIATSHFYPHRENVGDFLRRRRMAREQLEAAREGRYPSIRLGAEVLICNNIDKMMGIEELCIENSRVLLIEMPFARKWESGLIETLVRLRDKNGLKVILAHGERYPIKELEKLLRSGFRTQVNVSSIKCFYTRYVVKKWIKQNYVAAFGSDIHGLRNYYREYVGCMKKLGPLATKVLEEALILLEEK